MTLERYVAALDDLSWAAQTGHAAAAACKPLITGSPVWQDDEQLDQVSYGKLRT
jgi:hypothetical protein